MLNRVRCSTIDPFTSLNGTLTLGLRDRRRITMSLTHSLNLLMISAAFVFVGAMVLGVLP